jgi:carboxylesterase
MLHGFLGSPASSNPMASYLSGRGITVHCPLLPGHGELPNKLVGASREAWLAEAEEGLARLQQQCEEIFLLGHSMGTVLCAYLASKETDINGIILFAPLDTLPDKRLHAFRALRYVMPWLYPMKFGNLRELVVERLHEFDPSIDLDDPDVKSRIPEMTRVPTAAIDEMRKTVSMGRKLWPQLTFPAAIFQGGADIASDPDGAREVFNSLAAIDKQLFFFESAGHELMRPSDPAHLEIWSDVYQFISTHSSLDQ